MCVIVSTCAACRWAVGISSAVLTHAFLEMVYSYALLYTRLRVPTPPAGQTDIRKQVMRPHLCHNATSLC
jgi:hypothetical protein